jgi:hypothetical protein
MPTRQLAKQLFITLALNLLLAVAIISQAQESDVSNSASVAERLDEITRPLEISEQQRKDNELEELGIAIKEKAHQLKTLKSKVRKSLSNPELELEI